MKTRITKIISFAALSCFLLIAAKTTAKLDEASTRGGIEIPPPVQIIRMQANNISVPFWTNGIMCSDVWHTIWPVTAASINEINYTAGIWIGAKVVLPGNQKELRLTAAFFNSHFSPGNIPVVGGVPPQAVCNDRKWRGYYVQLTDPSLVNGGTRIKIAGGVAFTFNYDPWSLWPVRLGAPYVEVNGIAGYQPGWNSDRPGIGNSDARPDDLLFMVYMDYTNCTNNIHLSEISLPGGSLPLGVEMQQLSFAFNCPPLRDMYFVKCKVINKSGKQWDSTYIAYVDDIDIGGGTLSSRDDAVGCDSVRDMGYIYNFDNNDPQYGINPPAMGYRLLQGPLKYTGNSNDTAKLPYDTLIGYRILGLKTFTKFINGSPDPCLNDPDNYISGYNFMRGLDGCGRTRINPITGQPTTLWYTGDACNRIGWFDSAAHDVRFLMGSGPFVMNYTELLSVNPFYIAFHRMDLRDQRDNHKNY